MPRDSTGTFSLPSGTLVNTGDTILVSQHNPAMQDIQAALTGSLARNGTGGMQAVLNMNGFTVSSVADGAADSDAVNKGQLDAAIAALNPSVPIGVVVDFWGTALPDGFLLCGGQEVSRATYADLFAVIGTTAGPGNGTTTFNLPDYRGLASVGKADMGGTLSTRLSNFAATILGGIFGSQSHTLTSGEMPSHNHGVTDPGHSHSYSRTNVAAGSFVDSGTGAVLGTFSTGSATTGISINSTGGGAAHNNVQPSVVCNKIIKAFV